MLVELMKNVAGENVVENGTDVIEVAENSINTVKKVAIVAGGVAVAAGITYLAVKGSFKLYDKVFKNKIEEEKKA